MAGMKTQNFLQVTEPEVKNYNHIETSYVGVEYVTKVENEDEKSGVKRELEVSMKNEDEKSSFKCKLEVKNEDEKSSFKRELEVKNEDEKSSVKRELEVKNEDEKLAFKAESEDTKISLGVEQPKREGDLKNEAVLEELPKPLQDTLDLFGNEMPVDEEYASDYRPMSAPQVAMIGTGMPAEKDAASTPVASQTAAKEVDTYLGIEALSSTSKSVTSQREQAELGPEITVFEVEEIMDIVPQHADAPDNTFIPEGVEIIDADLYKETMGVEVMNPKPRDVTPVRRNAQDQQKPVDVDLYTGAMDEEILNPELRDATPVRRNSQDQQQPKRRRMILDAVEVPSLKNVLRRAAQDRQDAEDLKKVEKMLNPKTTLKKMEFCFSLNTIRDRLRPIGLDPYPINSDLDDSTKEVMVTRDFMSSVYGGGLQCAWAKVSEGKQAQNNHNYPGFLYLSLGLNCHAPEMPGSPGLYFNPGCEGVASPIPGVHKLLTRITTGSKAITTPLWQYQGEYELKPASSLTAQEWRSVDSSVRKNWADEIWKSTAWGKGARARIFLRRRHGRECTDQEFFEIIDDQRTYQEEVSAEDIAQALLRGEEKVAVWTMKCVGYDTAFQHDLAAKFATWNPPPKAAKKKDQRAAQKKKDEKDEKPAQKKKIRVKKESKDETAAATTRKRPVKGKKRNRDWETSDESDESDEA